MVTENAEQLAGAAEQTQQSSEQGATGKVSGDAAQSSTKQDDNQAKSPNIEALIQERLNKLIPEWQSQTDKAIAKVVTPLRQKLASYEEKERLAKEEAALQAQEEAETEQWEGDGTKKTEIVSFQQARKDLIKRRAELSGQIAQYNQQITLSRLMLSAMPEDLKNELMPLVKPITERAKTPEHEDDLIESHKSNVQKILAKYFSPAKVENPAEKKEPDPTKNKAPDSSIPSAQGSVDISTLSPREKIDEGLKRASKHK